MNKYVTKINAVNFYPLKKPYNMSYSQVYPSYPQVFYVFFIHNIMQIYNLHNIFLQLFTYFLLQ